jgi:hypothetical protein
MRGKLHFVVAYEEEDSSIKLGVFFSQEIFIFKSWVIHPADRYSKVIKIIFQTYIKVAVSW